MYFDAWEYRLRSNPFRLIDIYLYLQSLAAILERSKYDIKKTWKMKELIGSCSQIVWLLSTHQKPPAAERNGRLDSGTESE